MTIVQGKIESLKKVKYILEQRGINRFKSIKDINSFLANYEYEKQQVKTQIESDFSNEIEGLREKKSKLEQNCDKLKTEKENSLNTKINKLRNKYDNLVSGNLIITFQKEILRLRINYLIRNFNIIILRHVSSEERNIDKINLKINKLIMNRESIISESYIKKGKELIYAKNVVDEMYPIIAGAIGESLVEKELNKLSDKHILINDFSVKFNPPIYNKQEKDKIFSIQIDHLLISNSGVFLLETKNWSKKSIESLDLRSPVAQIKRAGFALFVVLNSNQNSAFKKVALNYHHWGEKEIPVRKVIVMIHGKPREKFKYVNIKRVDELNKYITGFDPIFGDDEVYSIFEYLNSLNITTANKRL